MLEKVLQAILRRYFGEFLTGLENVQLAFWTGKINIQNASFKHDKINELIKSHNLPFSIKFSYIGSLQIDIPWNKLSSAPVQLIISDIFIVLKLQQITLNDLNQTKDDISQNSKFLLIKKYAEYMIKKAVQMKIENNQSGYLNRLIMKILHNMNIKIGNISFRIENQGLFNKEVFVKKQNQDEEMQQFQDFDQQFNQTSRKLSQISEASTKRRRSSAINVSDKPFALGFCIKQFVAFTIDEKGERRFINVQNQNVKFSKMIQLHQISLYWEEIMTQNLYKKTSQQRINFIKGLIDRKEYRLLTIDGKVLLKKNHDENVIINEEKKQNKEYAYFLSSQFQELSIQANYEQIKEMILIFQTLKVQRQKVSILKLKQLEKKQQLLLEKPYKQYFSNLLYPKNFQLPKQKNKPSKEFGEIKNIFNGVDKKLLMKWTKQTMIEIIKKEKEQNRLKQKNKKGWLSFFSNQQDEIKLDENDYKIIQEEIKNLIALTQEKQLKSFIKNLVIQKLVLKIKKEIKSKKKSDSSIFQQIALRFDHFHVNLMKFDKEMTGTVEVKNIQLAYEDFSENSKVKILQITQQEPQRSFLKSQFHEIEDRSFAEQESEKFALQFQWKKIKSETNIQKIDLRLQPIKFKHEIKVLSFVSHMLKLRHDNEKIRSDLIVFKAQVQNSIPEEQIELFDTIYEISVQIKRISVLIQLNQQSYLKAYVQSISLQSEGQKNLHNIKLQNFGLKFVKNSLIIEEQLNRKNISQSEIISDFSIDIHTKGLKKIESKISEIKVTICEDEMSDIYKSLIKQSEIFSSQKKQYQKQKIIEQVFLQSKVSIINAFRVRYDYLAVLYEDSIALYSLKKGIENLEQLILNQEDLTPKLSIPLAKLKTFKKSSTQLKLQSLFVNEIFEMQSEQTIDQWISLIEQRIFDFRARNQMYKLIEEEQKAMQQGQNQKSPAKQTLSLIYKYETQINIIAERIQILYCKKFDDPFISVDIRQLGLHLEENNFTYQRNIIFQGIQIIDQEIPKQSPFRKVLSNLVQQKNDEFIMFEQQQNPIKITLSGKKKLHPNYTGELQINIDLKDTLVNFNAELLYTIIDKMTYRKPQKIMTTNQQDNFVLQLFSKILQSDETKELEQKIKNSQQIKDSSIYIDIDKFKKIFTCLVLLNLKIKSENLSLYMIQGRTKQVPFVAEVKNTEVNIDKGKNFLFVKVKIQQIDVYDLTGYPKTNTDQWKIKQRLAVMKTQIERSCQNAVQFYYSAFPTETIINKNRFRSFTHIIANDLEIVYQSQPLMRFIDYLTNQLILFFMEPPFLHKYDERARGQFKYGQFYYTKQEIEEYVNSIAVPFFNELKIYANNLVAYLNTFPGKQSIKLHIDKVYIYPENRLQSKRISFNVSQLISWQNKYDQFCRLCEMESFQQNILKSQWSNRLIIKAEGMSSEIFKKKFNYEMYHERCLHQEKQFLLPCLKINKEMIEEAIIKNLTILAPKPIYNLINKFFTFNLTYDDELDCQYITNYQHQKKVPIVELVYKIRINQFTLLIPEVNESVISIQDMMYKWARYPDMLKEMAVTGRAIHILGTKNFIVPFQSKGEKGLQYLIEMKPDGNKTMSTFFRNCQIIYDWDLFSLLLQYFLLDDSCYPPQKSYPDLPLISCHFYFLDSFIRLAKTESHYYALNGDITFSWIRMKVPHPETYKNDRRNFPLGKVGSLYLAKIKECNLKKFQTKNYEKQVFNNFRLLSLPITLDMKWQNIMKMTQSMVQYADWIVEYDIKSLFLKLSYIDIEDLKKPFVKQNQENQPPPPALPYTQYVQHIFNFEKLSIQMGVSQLPVPLLDVSFEGKIMLQLLDKTTSVNLQIYNLSSKYWNMLIGRWEPILQKLNGSSNLKFSQNGVYVIFDCPSIVYLDVSMDSLKVINLISDDFAKKGKGVLNLVKKNVISDEFKISPYIITNRTSLPVRVSSHGMTSTAIANNQKLHLETSFLEDTNKLMGTIFLQIQNEPKLYQIDLNISSIVKTRVKYNEIEYDIFFQPISSPVVKEIIITSPYVLSNRTSHKVVVGLHNKQYFLNPDEKQAIPFYEILQNKQFRIEFPHLKNVTENYPFTFKDIQKGYQHYINLQGQQFNCTLSIKQDTMQQSSNKDEQNFIEIDIAPVYYFKNLLPVDIVLQFNIQLNNFTRLVTLKLAVNEEKQIYQVNTIQDTMFRVQMKGYHFSEFVYLSKNQQPNYSPQEILIHDHRALNGKIKVKTVQQGKMRKVYLFSQAILINQTAQNIFTFSGAQLLSGQMVSQIPQSSTKYIMINPSNDKVLNFGFDEDVPFRSNQFSITQLGNQQLTMVKNNQFFQFTLNNTLQCLSLEAQIYCNVLKVMPKYILINSTSRVIQLKQQNTQKINHLMPTERINWIWTNFDQQRLLSFKPIDNEVSQNDPNSEWAFSAGFNLETIEDTVIIIRPLDKKLDKKLLLKIEVHKQYQQNFIVFKQIFSQQLNRASQDFLLFQNDLKLARIEFYQNCFDSHQDFEESPVKPFKALPGQKVLFGWQNTQKPQELKIKIQFLGPLRAKHRNQIFTVNVKQKNIIEKIFENGQGETFQIQFVIQTIGLKKKIRMREKDLQESVLEMNLLGGGNKVGISLHELGISIISSGKNRRQVIYVSLKKFEIILMEESQLRKIQVKIKYISIDNNSNHNTIYPVLFTPLKHQKTWTKSRPFFVMLTQTNLNQQGTTQIKQFRMCMQSISLKIHDQVLIKLYDMYKQFGSSQKVNQNSDLHKIFRSYEQHFQWQEKQVQKLENQIFFRQFQIAKLSIEISFSIRPKINKGNYLIFTILSSFGMAISNISESQLTLSRFFKKQVTLTQLKNQISEFYIKQFIKGIYKILGSITLFGNPYVFVRLLAQGAWQIVNQPTQGFIKGPIQGTIGIAKGGIFFTRNIVAGTFNSFQAISESLSRGISYMTLDQKFIQRREKIKQQKSNHVFQGLTNGLFALYTGFQVAVTGLYRLPAEGYRKQGFGAGLTGALKGITGLVTKPISGMFEGVSKLSQGIKNTALLFQDGPNTKRSRHPRVFLSNQKYYTNYNHLEAYTIAFLQHLSTKYLNIQILFISVTENIPENIMKSLVLTQKYLLIVDLIERSVETEIILHDIETVEVADQNIVRISTKYDQEIQIEEQPLKCQQLIQAFKMSKQFL